MGGRSQAKLGGGACKAMYIRKTFDSKLVNSAIEQELRDQRLDDWTNATSSANSFGMVNTRQLAVVHDRPYCEFVQHRLLLFFVQSYRATTSAF